MNRIDRLFGILTTLQSRKYTTADFLAEKFEISVRTVYRDIKALTETGIPVSFEQARGYFIVQGFFLPPLSLTSDEANALILMASLAEKFADGSISRHSTSAITKLRNVLKHTDKDKAEVLANNIRAFVVPDERSDIHNLDLIQKSITDRIILRIRYMNNDKVRSEREVEPIGLAFYNNQWHLIAWCWNRNEYRDFKVKMISSLVSMQQGFRMKKHWSLDQYIQSLS